MRQMSDARADQDKKLFVGGLNFATSEEQLKDYYSQWGEVTDVVVMKDQRTRKSRGFGFVTFALSSSVDDAQNSRPHNLGGKQIDSKRAMPREETSPEVHAAVKKVFVGALKKDVTNDDLSSYFSKFGQVVDAQVVIAKDRNESRGFAFVTFGDTDPVDKIILARPHHLNGNKIDVRKALSKDEMGKLRARSMRQDQSAPPQYDQGYGNNYNQGYAPQSYSNYNGSYGNGYGYEQPPPPQPKSWGPPPPAPVDNAFGSYPPQAYGGGPMRGAPPPYARPAPYAGPNNWQR